MTKQVISGLDYFLDAMCKKLFIVLSILVSYITPASAELLAAHWLFGVICMLVSEFVKLLDQT